MMSNTVLGTSDTQKKAARPSSEELSFRGERQACDRQWPRILSHLRTSATQLHRGCGGGEGTKQKAVDVGRSGRPWPVSASGTDTPGQLALCTHFSFVGIPCC